MNMRILFLTNDGEGLYKFRKELLIRLLKNNDVFISLPKDKYKDKLTELGCSFIDTEFNRKGINPANDIKLMNTYRSIIKDVRPDIVLTYTIKPNVYGGLACQKENVPYIANITGLGSALENKGILQPIVINLYKMGLKNAKKVFFQNEDNKNFMIEKEIIKGNYEIVPGSGVNIDQYKLLDYPDDETIDFVYIGRIMTEKGFRQYLDAAKVIRIKYPNTRFHICGEYEDDYRDEVNKLSKDEVVIYHGSVVDMTEIYRIIQCTIHPTYYPEGLSNVLLESCASGRAIITTNRAGCKEVVEDGVNGFVVNQKDSADLICKIEKFISLSNEERKQMGINGRRKVEKEFNRNIVIDAYIKEINS